MSILGILLPTYKRPDSLERVAKNIKETTKNSYTLYFGVEPEDEVSILAAQKIANVVSAPNFHEPGYSGAIQSMYETSTEPFLFHANDDFEFLPNWDEHPIAMFETPQVQVVGVPQNEADKTYSAICFFRRSYIERQSGVVDMPNRVFYPYHHNYQDTEFTRTAQSRAVWFSSDVPCINHLHPGFTGKEKDEVYLKNDATIEEDKKTFESRQHLW